MLINNINNLVFFYCFDIKKTPCGKKITYCALKTKRYFVIDEFNLVEP